MHKVFQSNTSCTEGDCFAACVASVCELALKEVPADLGHSREGRNWFHRTIEWLRERGYAWLYISNPSDNEKNFFRIMIPNKVYLIVSGTSPRGTHRHSVIYGYDDKTGEMGMLHDPHPEGTGIETFMDALLIWRK